MAKRFIQSALADISQDIAGSVPIDLVKKWASSTKTNDVHKEILEPFMIRGTVVTSDSAGLSKLSQEKTLLEVMQLVNFPKEVVFKHGKQIGGRAIGVWTADNSQMFYGGEIHPQDVIEKMKIVQSELRDFELQIGIAIHAGEFFEIGGGLYGEDADFVENLAENETAGGQILISASARKIKRSLSLRDKMKKQKIKAIESKNEDYPYPFSKEFYKDIKNNDISKLEIHNEINKKYSKNKVVILIKILHKKQKFLLEELSQRLLANLIINEFATNYKTDKMSKARAMSVKKIKSNGDVGIFVSENEKAAVDFAQNLRAELRDNGFDVNIGLAQGEVFIFELTKDSFDICGEPVNIASKLAEDSKSKNAILIEKSLTTQEKGEKFKYEISHVGLFGVKI